jgi:anti-repressor protein
LNELQTPIEIALQIDENGMTTARKLYEFLELSKSQFSRWCKLNIIGNAFAEKGSDYIGFDH